MKLYLDTSIPSAYYDGRATERQDATRAFWSKVLPGADVFISDLVLTEIERTPSEDKRQKMLELVDGIPSFVPDKETLRLASVIHQAQLVPQNKFDDAIHLAIAAVEGVDVVVSWNFRHMVNLRVKRSLPAILAQERYLRHYEIISPYEYIEE